MNKIQTLASLIASGFVASSVVASDPDELYQRMMARKDGVTEHLTEVNEYKVATELNTTNYNIVTIASRTTPHNTNQPVVRSLDFNLKDKETSLWVTDHYANGLSNQDFLTLSHRFKNKDQLSMSIEYFKEGDLRISTRISSMANTNSSCSFTFDMREIRFGRGIARRGISDLINWGKRTYSDLVIGISKESTPQIPYAQLKNALADVETSLPAIKAGNTASENALYKLKKKYYPLITQKTNP